MKTFKNWVYISEQNINGEYNTAESYEYLLESDHLITSEEFMDLLYQACEIERIYKGSIWVEKMVEEDGVYFDSDECEFEVNIQLTQELSPYINWDKCPSLPSIYKIDRKKSIIKARF